MRYALLVLTPPDTGASARHALEFAQAALDAGHEILCTFFFDSGVLTAAEGKVAQDEEDLRAGWSSLQQDHALKLVACVASAQRFGVTLSEGSPFEIAGLGELIEASGQADRVLTFRG